MRIVVLGATGMAGAAVVAEALRRGHDVTAVSRRTALRQLAASLPVCWTSLTSTALRTS